jgi:hypothetical protein
MYQIPQEYTPIGNKSQDHSTIRKFWEKMSYWLFYF